MDKSNNVCKVLVTDYEFSTLEFEKEELEKYGVKLESIQSKSEENIISRAKDFQGLLVQYAPITSKVINNLPKLKAIAVYAIGVDNIDVEAATKKKVYVINVPSFCEDEVSNHALGLLIACNRKILYCNHQVKNGIWGYIEAGPIYRFKGRRLGLLGFGKIARLLAKKTCALGLEVFVFDPYIKDDIVKEYGAKPVDFNFLIKNSHYISIHLPLTKETRHLINKDVISKMRKDAYLINTSRGGVIDEKALINALKEGLIQGAGLDVFEEEPISENCLLKKLNNVIITPHIAWYSITAEEELRRKAARNLGRVLTGDDNVETIVNREVMYPF